MTRRCAPRSEWDSACAPPICTRPATRVCRATRGARPVSSRATTACTSSQIRTRTFREKNVSTCTRCASPPGSCGDRSPRREIRFTWTCGTTPLSESDSKRGGEYLPDLPRLPRDEGGPVFAEPWQAQAFALTVKLSEQGDFTWKEWAAGLPEGLQAAAKGGEPDDGSRYYEHWLAALERLVTAKGLTDQNALLTRREAWAEAYRATPHGTPVELASRKPDARWVLLGVA